jgi:hypothetical protein
MDAAANDSQECRKLGFIIIILGSKPLEPAERELPDSDSRQALQAAGESNSAYCRDDFTCHLSQKYVGT